MTRRERVLNALNFKETDRAPMDLGGMLSTGVSCFAYPDLVRALGLEARPPMIYDTGQMLAMPEPDVLDALDCDVAAIFLDFGNSALSREGWHPYDFNGRLPALVRDPRAFTVDEEGVIHQPAMETKMPPAAHVFESAHGGQPMLLTGDLPKPDLKALKQDLEARRFSDQQLKSIADHCRRSREATDRAILFNGPGAEIGIANFGGLATFPMLCLTEPDFVHELHDLVIRYAAEQLGRLLSEIHPYIDVYQCCSDDWGTQNATIASPEIFRTLFQPYYQRFTDTLHATGPGVKAFLHSCGAIYEILDDIIDCGFDVLNPVQWTAGGHSFREWKDKCRGRIALWGGGVHAQETLPLASIEAIETEVAEIVGYMKQDGGYVFNSIHNLLAEIPGDKIVALYRAAARA